jgi:hypothetical protein|nr:MAG TPA: hypothetical protein [Caudoviricetes sp.]
MKTKNQRFNERFLDNVFSFEDLLRTLKFNQIRLNNRRAAGIKEKITVWELIKPESIYVHNIKLQDMKRINERILLRYYYEADKHRLRSYGTVEDIILNVYKNCKQTKRFIGRVIYYTNLLRRIGQILDTIED